MKTLKDFGWIYPTDENMPSPRQVSDQVRYSLRQGAINSIKEIENAPQVADGFVEVDGFMFHKETARTLLKYLNNLEEKDLR